MADLERLDRARRQCDLTMKICIPIIIGCGLITAICTVYIALFDIECTNSSVRAPSFSPTHLSQEPVASPDSRDARTVLTTPEEEPPLGVEPEDHSLVETFDNAPPLAFSSKTVLAFVKEHPNSPLKFVPKDATDLQLTYLEGQAEVILTDWQRVRDELWSAHQENLLAFTVDPSVLANDRQRQSRLKNLMLSLWPESMK